ncbi:peroxiredoxin [Haloarchaeobius iranensis]|uniref:Peroxiredoxin n=1 Tax=Haloarchaeobius iranensis TaxID=996166 RepID=A0A1G9YLF2_9EURY|nr:peroxiredoxin [Haloarchaeobius iranensis]SDN09802.1 peroxiredoxin (alkyl hydroperoxide reductase subunit C) [Haloarchaeobius iranensis]
MNPDETPRKPGLGDEFPELTVQTSHGEISLPDDYEGEWFVLFSHPGDFTPVCTTEFVAFQQRATEFEELGVSLVGLSVDRVHSHIKWVEWIEDELDESIEFPIIADEGGTVATRLGMLHPEMGSSTVRSVYIVDPGGVIRLELQYPMEIGRNIDEILRSIRALQTADATDVAVPADWPDNENFGDRVLLEPPADVAAAEERVARAEEQGYECLDWWFCLQE